MKQINKLFKIFAVLLTMLSFSGCDTKNSLSLKLTDNLPVFPLEGNYTKAKQKTYDDGYEMLWAYDGDDSTEYRYVCGYKWPVSDKTLIEEVKSDADYYYPNQNPEVIVTDYWNEPHDYEFAYYVAIEEDKNLMAQNWVFVDGDYFYQIYSCYDLVSYTVEGTDIKFSIPDRLKEIETDYDSKSFIDPNCKDGLAEFANVDVHLINLDSEFTKEKIEKKWGVKNVEIIERSYKTNDGTSEYPGYEVHCDYDEDGKTIACDEYLIRFSNNYFGIEFLYDKEAGYADYIKNSYAAFLYTVVEE